MSLSYHTGLKKGFRFFQFEIFELFGINKENKNKNKKRAKGEGEGEVLNMSINEYVQQTTR